MSVKKQLKSMGYSKDFIKKLLQKDKEYSKKFKLLSKKN